MNLFNCILPVIIEVKRGKQNPAKQTNVLNRN